MARPVADASREYRGGGTPPHRDALGLGRRLGDSQQVLGERPVEAVALRRKHGDQRIVRRLCDGGFRGGAGGCPAQARVGLVTTGDRVERVVHGDVNDGEGQAGTTGAKLLAEGAVFTWRERRVIQTAGINRNLVPMTQSASAAQIAVELL